VPEYAFNLQLAQQIKETLVDAGFDKTVLLITAKRRRSGCSSGRASPIACRPTCLFRFITIRCPTISFTPGSTGQDQQYNDDYPGYALFISNDNADRAAACYSANFWARRCKHAACSSQRIIRWR